MLRLVIELLYVFQPYFPITKFATFTLAFALPVSLLSFPLSLSPCLSLFFDIPKTLSQLFRVLREEQDRER